MGFIEYYKKHSQWHQMFSLDELPGDVREDLKTLIKSEDKRIGFYVGPVHNWNKTRTEIVFEGLSIMYYVRTWHPTLCYSEWFGHMVPAGIRFWRMKKVAGGY